MVWAMKLVEAARFMDLAEAQVAASALRASGIFCFVQNDGVCQALFTHQIAFGGCRIWVPVEDADDVRAFISANRGVPSSLSDIWPSAGMLQAFFSMILLVLTGAYFPLRIGPATKRTFEDEEDANSSTTLAT